MTAGFRPVVTDPWILPEDAQQNEQSHRSHSQVASVCLVRQEISGISIHDDGLSDFNKGQTQALQERYVTKHIITPHIQANHRKMLFVYNSCLFFLCHIYS